MRSFSFLGALGLFLFLLCGCGTPMGVVIPDEGGTTDASTKSDATTGNDGSSSDSATSDAPADGTVQDSSTLDGGKGTYAAYAILGGLDRMRIVKNLGSTCIYIQLVSPSGMSGGLTLPNNWFFESARALQPQAACDPKYLGPISNMFDATSQSGTIQFSGNPFPQFITSVMVTVNFANNPMWCPASEVFSATNVMVQ